MTSILLLDSAFLPHSFLSRRAAFLHILKGSVKCFDKESNLIESEEWIKGIGELYKDQPYIRTKEKKWYIPTILVLKNNYLKNRVPRRMSLSRLCGIFDFKCQICEKTYSKEELTIEHIYPKSKGGTRGIENITLTCQKCNREKKDDYPYKKELKTVPLPMIARTEEVREEWEKFFIYERRDNSQI